MGDYAEAAGREERRTNVAAAIVGVLYVAGVGALFVPELGVVAGSLTAAALATTFARDKWTPLRGLREEKLVRSLRKARVVEGVVVPLRPVESQEGACCAFDHVVHRCEACACTRPCSRAGGRYRAEDRGAGRFVVRNDAQMVLIDGHDVRFASTLGERMTSHFHRLEAGQHIRVHGELIDTTNVDDDVRALVAGAREIPRVLVPREGSSVLVEALDR
ncbi:MAG: hypothetical protein J0L92_12850 [Deltaproteobacteria bacterium]|nr:hypothetical protein [Deltaproteobacteria bacterium]